MAIELSNLTFTEQDDIVPPSGVEPIFNTGIPNTLAGNDILTGTWSTISDGIIIDPSKYTYGAIIGFYNTGTLNTADGNDIVTGIIPTGLLGYFTAAIYNEGGTIDTGDGNDIITGRYGLKDDVDKSTGYGIYSLGTIDTGDGDDLITGTAPSNGGGISFTDADIITSNGNDTINGIGGVGLSNYDGTNIDTGNGDDIITGTGSAGIHNYHSTITTDDGNDIITGAGTSGSGILNSSFTARGILRIRGVINTGDGNDLITGTSTDGIGINNIIQFSTIDTGDGNDVINGIGSIGIYNDGTINTGNGEDSIIADGGFDGVGSVFLGNAKDYLKGFGSGNFNGGNGQDILELTSGSYTVGILGTTVSFTKSGVIMQTSEFEKLQAGNITYNFNSLTNGQTIFVA
jgi:hypothetical protein